MQETINFIYWFIKEKKNLYMLIAGRWTFTQRVEIRHNSYGFPASLFDEICSLNTPLTLAFDMQYSIHIIYRSLYSITPLSSAYSYYQILFPAFVPSVGDWHTWCRDSYQLWLPFSNYKVMNDSMPHCYNMFWCTCTHQSCCLLPFHILLLCIYSVWCSLPL